MRLQLPITLAAAALIAVAAPAHAGTKVKVTADQMRLVDETGEAARAEGRVTIEVPGEVRIEAPVAKLFKGSDGQLERVEFPGWVRVTDLRPSEEGQWRSESNSGGVYDFRTGHYTEFNPTGAFELAPGQAP